MAELGPATRTEVGSKAWTLAELGRHGVPVPPGVVVPVDAYLQFMESNRLTKRAAAGGDERLAEDILRGTLSPELAGALRVEAARLGSRLVVRSSGVEEDGGLESYAGQYDTVLGVAPGDETEAAVLRCWASAWSQRAMAYRVDRGEVRPPRMAVLIQPLIVPRCAGVMFTINPLTGSWREMTVEAAWGQGDSVVSGAVVPDFYVVRRPRRSPRPVQRILARVQLEVVSDHVRSQAHMHQVGEEEPVPVPAARVDAPKLRHAELLKLCRLGLRLEGLLGAPQDVEWAVEPSGRVVVLQSRPVTTSAGVRRAGPVLWTRQFIGERWAEPATPLGWSVMRDLIDGLIAYPETQSRLLDGGEATQLVRFAPYFNVTVFRHLAFKLPGAPPPRFMMELLPPEEERSWVRRRAQAPDFRVYGSILRETLALRRWRRFRWNPLTNPRAWRAYEVELDDALGGLCRPIEDLAQAQEVRRACRALAERYVGVHICSLLFANLLFELCEAALEARGLRALARDALRPVEQSWTVRTNQALWRLGRGEIEQADFLRDFGHRAASSWELFSPRWVEAPERVEVLCSAAAQHADPGSMATTQAARAMAARAELPPGLRRVVALTQDYLLLREDQRYHFDRLLWTWKKAFLWIEGELGLPIRFLERVELDALLDGVLEHSEAEERVFRRQAAWRDEVAQRGAGDEPPVFLVGADAVAPAAAAQRLQGMGISRGTVTGTVRVMRSLDEAGRLGPGDILVARTTDPGWTPLFMKAGGLVMELGGMLSHGAVVAREYGLPAVVNVQGATTVLRDGDRVTIDGTRGVVWVR
jgi:pyruvate,water dikinase